MIGSIFMNEIPEFKDIIINGFYTVYAEAEDSHGKFLFIGIPKDADKSISDLIDQFIDGHLIKEIGYHSQDGKVVAIKAYYY